MNWIDSNYSLNWKFIYECRQDENMGQLEIHICDKMCWKKTEARLDSCQTLYKRVTKVNSVKFEFWKSSGNGGVTYSQKMKTKQHNIKYGNQNTIHMNRYNSDTIIYFYGYIHILYAPIIKKTTRKPLDMLNIWGTYNCAACILCTFRL